MEQNQFKPLSNTEVSAFCSQMALVLNAGLSTIEGITIMMEDALSKEEKEILEKIHHTLMSTGNFHESLKDAGVFPRYALSMVHIGEISGRLDNVMTSLSQHYEREQAISQAIKSAVTYPLIMISMMLLIIAVLLVKVMPIFNQVFLQLGQQMEGLSGVLLNMGNAVGRYSYVFIAAIIILLGLFLYFSRSAKGRRQMVNITTKIPAFRSLSEKIATGRFASGMSLTLSSGLTTEQSLEMAATLADDSILEQKINNCQKIMEEGTEFSTALTDAKLFSGIYGRMIAVGSRTGSLEEVMGEIARQYQDEADTKINSVISILEPTLVAILSIIVGMILLSVMLPLMGIMSGM